MSDKSPRDQLAELLAERQRCCPSLGRAQADADVAIAAGWRPPARVIEDPGELADIGIVPRGSIVRAADGTIACRYDAHTGVVFGDDRPFGWDVLRTPATILLDPTEGADRG